MCWQELLKLKDQLSTLERQLQSWRSEAMEESSLKELNAWAERKVRNSFENPSKSL